MCPLGDPNSGSSGMCAFVCVGSGPGMQAQECLSVHVWLCSGHCVLSEVCERGVQSKLLQMFVPITCPKKDQLHFAYTYTVNVQIVR